jgi:hypothetical protein
MGREVLGVGLDENATEASKLRTLFADAFGADVMSQLIPRLRLLRVGQAKEDWCPSPSLLLT